MQFDAIRENVYYPLNKAFIKFIDPEIGLGVFAAKNIKRGDIVERCPMIPLSWKRRYHNDPQLNRYLYTNQGCQCEDCAIHGPSMYMVLGYGMIYNHHDSPNTKWNFDFKRLCADVVAEKTIEKNKQIFVSYGNQYFNSRNKILMDN